MCGFWRLRSLTMLGVVILGTNILLLLGVMFPRALAATQHPCAPQDPPPVGGQLTQPPAETNIIFINEVLPVAGPHTAWNCSGDASTGAINSWIELYNPQNQAFDLYSSHLALDNGPGTSTFYLPFGSAIAARSFLVLFPTGNILSQAIGGAALRLTMAGTVIDQVTLRQTGPDQSYARTFDGGNIWQITNDPTIDTSNTIPVMIPTPKPTPTLKPTATPRPTPTPKASPTPRISEGSATTKGTAPGTGEAQQSEAINGTQPAWKSMQLPGDTQPPPTPVAFTAPDTTVQTPQKTDLGDTSRKWLFTAGIIVLVLALVWGWRRFARH